MLDGEHAGKQRIVVRKDQAAGTKDDVVGVARAADLKVEVAGGAVLLIALDIFGEDEAQLALRAAVHHDKKLLRQGRDDRGQGRALSVAAARQVQAREGAAVHEAGAADPLQRVGQAELLHLAQVQKGVVPDAFQRPRQRQPPDAPVVEVPLRHAAAKLQLLAGDVRRPGREAAVRQARDRQAEELVRQDGVSVAGRGAQDGDALPLAAELQAPVGEGGDGFHAVIGLQLCR